MRWILQEKRKPLMAPVGVSRAHLDAQGYVVLRRVVSAQAINAALRMLNLEIRRCGLTAQEIAENQTTTFFPHLRWEPQILSLLPEIAADILSLDEQDQWAEPQILIRFPDEDQQWPVHAHVDTPPEWAGDRSYKGIVGIALSDTTRIGGAARVWPESHLRVVTAHRPVPLKAGDALIMHPRLAHSGSLNLSSRIRYAIYFRLLGRSNAGSQLF